MQILIAVIFICVTLYCIDQFCLWLERKGWLYYRHNKPRGGFIGNALLELQSFFIPSARYTIEVKQNQTVRKRSEEDVPDEINKN
jgi:hypothetical protein